MTEFLSMFIINLYYFVSTDGPYDEDTPIADDATDGPTLTPADDQQNKAIGEFLIIIRVWFLKVEVRVYS